MSKEEIIAQRMPVWEALAELFFNSNISNANEITNYMINTCHKSGYSINMLEKIYQYEVLPTLFSYTSGYDYTNASIEPKLLKKLILATVHDHLVTENSTPTILNRLKSKYYSFLTRKNWRYFKHELKRARQGSNSTT